MATAANEIDIDYGEAADLAIEACVVIGQAICELPPGSEVRKRLERHQLRLGNKAAAAIRQAYNRKQFFEMITRGCRCP